LLVRRQVRSGRSSLDGLDNVLALLSEPCELAPPRARAIQLDPKNAHRYYNRGIAYSSKGDHDRAIQDYDRAIELDPKYGIAYDNRGYSYASKGDHDRTIQDYGRVIELNPKSAAAYFNRALAYASKGDHDRAIQDYDQAIQLTLGEAGTRGHEEND
jgi:tetratricopeptide (TPR) repeat protein